MNVGFIGAGKAGTAFGCYLVKKGIKISGYCSRNISSSQYAAIRTQSTAYDSINKLVCDSFIIAVTVPDDTISDIANALSFLPVNWNQKTILHMSGVHSSDIFTPLEKKGAAVCSLHPMLSFGDIDSAVSALESAPFTMEGKGEMLAVIRKILETCGNPWTEISSENKIMYHLAACTASNYLVTLMDAAMQMLQAAGFDNSKANALLEPLVRKAMDNVFAFGTQKALTGPISRGDTGTIEKHLKELQGYNNAWSDIYKTMGLETINLAIRAEKINKKAAANMREVIKNYE